MSTANFHNKNAGRIYACETEDEFDSEDLIGNIRSALRSAAEYPRQKAIADFGEVTDSWESDGLRSYPGRIIACVESETKSYQDFDVSLSAEIIVRSGYYTGVNLDYDLCFHVDGEEVEKDSLEEACANSALPGTRRAYLLALAQKWLDRTLESFTKSIEGIFSEYSTPLRVVATFSNGEALYEKV